MDNIPVEFYQTWSDIVVGDIMALFYAFYCGILELHRVNYGVITLLHKLDGANKIQQF